MKFPYDEGYDPPAPTMEVWLALPEQAFILGPLRAFIDTGADASLVPIQYLRKLGADAFDLKWLRSQWGEVRQVETYLVDVSVGGLRLPLVEVVADDQADETLLGRNVLNALRLTLDGPRQTVEIRG